MKKPTIEDVKKETISKLIKLGYTIEQAEKTANTFIKISAYYNGIPSKVKTSDGKEIYL